MIRIDLFLLLIPTVLAGCAATTEQTPAPIPTPAYTPDTFEPVPNYQYLPSPVSQAEREVLGRLEQELTYLQRLAREAQAQRNPGARVQFRYDALMRDLDEIRHGIREHLQAPDWQPRAFKPLRGDYRERYMTPEMEAAFELGAGFGVTDLYRVIAALVASAVFIWAAWVIVSSFIHWARGNEDRGYELGTSILTVLIVVTLVVGFL